MKQKTKRMVSLLLVIAMILGLLGMVSISVFAEESEETDSNLAVGGSTGNPDYEIEREYEEWHERNMKIVEDFKKKVNKCKDYHDMQNVLLDNYCNSTSYYISEDFSSLAGTIQETYGSFAQENLRTLVLAQFFELYPYFEENMDEKTINELGMSIDFVKSLNYFNFKDNITREQFTLLVLQSIFSMSKNMDMTLNDFLQLDKESKKVVSEMGEDSIVQTLSSSNFSDCDNCYIAFARVLGIVEGIGDNKFEPKREINREEALTILGKVYDLLGLSLKDYNLSSFQDASKVSKWSNKYIKGLIAKDIVDVSNKKEIGLNNVCTFEDYFVLNTNLYSYYIFMHKDMLL